MYSEHTVEMHNVAELMGLQGLISKSFCQCGFASLARHCKTNLNLSLGRFIKYTENQKLI